MRHEPLKGAERSCSSPGPRQAAPKRPTPSRASLPRPVRGHARRTARARRQGCVEEQPPAHARTCPEVRSPRGNKQALRTRDLRLVLAGITVRVRRSGWARVDLSDLAAPFAPSRALTKVQRYRGRRGLASSGHPRDALGGRAQPGERGRGARALARLHRGHILPAAGGDRLAVNRSARPRGGRLTALCRSLPAGPSREHDRAPSLSSRAPAFSASRSSITTATPPSRRTPRTLALSKTKPRESPRGAPVYRALAAGWW